MNWIATHTDAILLLAIFGTAMCGYYFGTREVQNKLEADIQHVLHENETLRGALYSLSRKTGQSAGSNIQQGRE